MNRSLSIILVTLLFLLVPFQNTYAQLETWAAINVTGSLKKTVGNKNRTFKNGLIEVYAGDSLVRQVRTNNRGRFSIPIGYDSVFTFHFGSIQEGHIPKSLVFDTKNTSEKYRSKESNRRIWNMTVAVFPPNDKVDFSILNKPVGFIAFNPEINDFDYDVEYTKRISKDINEMFERQKKVRKLEEALEKFDEESVNLLLSTQSEHYEAVISSKDSLISVLNEILKNKSQAINELSDESSELSILLRKSLEDYESAMEDTERELTDSISQITDKAGYESALRQLEIQKLMAVSKEDSERIVATERAIEQYMTNLAITEEIVLEQEDVITEKSEEVKTKNKQLLYATLAITLILVLTVLVFLSERRQRKAKAQIADQKLRIEAQKVEVEEAHEQLTEKNQEILDSIEYAKRIQNAILPPERIVKEYLDASFILYKPKDVVAGDFYWMETVDDVVYYAAADCTGHGVPGAMVSVICVNGLNRSVREFGLREPGEILDKTRELVIKEFEKSEEDVKDGMDISLCALSTKTNELMWAGAHNPLWIIREVGEESEEGAVLLSEVKGGPEGKVIQTSTPPSLTTDGLGLFELKADKQPIGKFELAKPFTTHRIQLNSGDTIYTFSDGYPDQFGGENGKKYKSGKFKRTLIAMSQKDIHEQHKLLDQEFESWRGEIEQIDDVCVIGVRV